MCTARRESGVTTPMLPIIPCHGGQVKGNLERRSREEEEAALGFEPRNNGFANRRLWPLGYAAGTTKLSAHAAGRLNRPDRTRRRQVSHSTFVLYADRSACQKNPLRRTMPNAKKGNLQAPPRRHKRIPVNFFARTKENCECPGEDSAHFSAESGEWSLTQCANHHIVGLLGPRSPGSDLGRRNGSGQLCETDFRPACGGENRCCVSMQGC